MRGTVANDLFVAVRSPLVQVEELLRAIPGFGLESGAVAAEVLVTADPAAPQKRFFVDEYYTRIEWRDGTHAEVQTNGATGSIEWTGSANDVLRAELRIYPDGAPESVGMFMRLLASLLLPSRCGVLIHASGVVVQGGAHLFLGESGAGKTTTARRAGRDGAMRIADDLAVLRVANDQSITVEACRFDRGGRLPGRVGGSWPIRAAYDVRKAAAVTNVGETVDNPLATWCAAILSSSGAPASRDSLLTLASMLSQNVPPRALSVSATGAVLSKLKSPPPHEEVLHAAPVYG